MSQHTETPSATLSGPTTDELGQGQQLPTEPADVVEETNPAEHKATPKQAQETLDRFERKVLSQRDANFEIAELGHQFLCEFLACSKEARRSVGVMKLIDVMGRHDDAAFLMPEKEAVPYLRRRLNVLLETGAACRLIGDGRGVEKGNATGRGRGRSGKVDSRLPWSVMVEFSRLVWRQDDDAQEQWSVYASIEGKAKALLIEVAQSGLPADNVRLAVRKLRLEDAELEYEAAVASADEARIAKATAAVKEWGGSVQREEERQARIKAAKEAARQPSADQGAQGATPGTETPPAELTPPTDQGAQDDGSDTAEDDDAEDAAEDAADDAEDAADEEKECRAQHLIKTGAEMSPKDAADWCVSFITQTGTPDDTVIELCRLVSLSKEFCRPVRDALAVAWHALAERYGTVHADTERDARRALESLQTPSQDAPAQEETVAA